MIDAQENNWRERLQGTLAQEPALISLALRWFAWLIAAAIIVFQAAPPINLVNAPLMLAVTLAQLIGTTIYPRSLRKYLPSKASHLMPKLWPLPDMALSLCAIYLTGGWDSPFYHYGITTVLAPSLRFGLVGALLASTLFTSLFLLTVKLTLSGFDPAYINDTQPEPGLISAPLNPIMIALYAAFLGEVLKKLAKEMDRSRVLATENERARMARDIHDGVSQTLFMLSMSLETGQVLAEKENAIKTAEHLSKLTPVAQKALLELRNAMHSVEPLADGKQTLGQAITQLVRDYQSATGQNVELTIDPAFECPQSIASTIFTMSQEALSNALQHSGGSSVSIKLADSKIEVSDNGKGFDPDQSKRGRGLNSLEDRAKKAQISHSLKSDNTGTKVTFSWEQEQK